MRRPELRKRFLGPADELNHLNDAVQYHARRKLPDSQLIPEALQRMRVLLDQAGEDDITIILQDHWSVYFEASGEFARAAMHRRREVDLIESMFRTGWPVPPIDEQHLRIVRQAYADDFSRIGAGANHLLARWTPSGPRA